MKCSEDEHNLLVTNIDLEAENFCSNAEICKGSECTHCHVIRSSDVMSAIGKLTRCTRGDARSFFCTYKTYLYAQN